MDWVGDRVLTHFGRHKAPLLESPRLAQGEQAIIMMSLIPNRKGQPLLVDWQVAVVNVSKPGQAVLEPFETFAQRAGLRNFSVKRSL